jgi:hypothetical protein
MAFDGPDGKRTATLMQRRHSILANNMLAMREYAFYFVYGFTMPVRLMDVIDMLIHSQAMDKANPTAGKFNKRVQETVECTKPIATIAINRTLDLKMISMIKEGTSKFYFFDPDQYAKVMKVLGYLEIIPEVIAEQLKNPFDPDAGSNLLPKEVYYNIVRGYK